MESIEIIMDGPLGEFVDRIYVNYSDTFEYEGIAEPLLGQEVFFSLGDRFQVGSHGFTPTRPNYPAIVGNRIRCFPVRSSGRHLTAGVIFKPWGLYSLYGIDGRRTANRVAGADCFPGMGRWMDLIGKWVNPCPAAVLETIESHLRKRALHSSPRDSFLRAFSALDRVSLGEAEIREVASEAGLSPKAFIGLFNEHLGLSPLKYVHAKGILQSLERLKAGGYGSLTQLALDLGFYDQPHFIRVFRAHMGVTPTGFINSFPLG